MVFRRAGASTCTGYRVGAFHHQESGPRVAFARGKGYIADNCTVSQNFLLPDEPVVLSLNSVKRLPTAAYLHLKPPNGVELADRFERAASVAEVLPEGAPMQHVP